MQVYLPKTLKAFENRRLKKVEDETEKLKADMEELKRDMKIKKGE